MLVFHLDKVRGRQLPEREAVGVHVADELHGGMQVLPAQAFL